MSRATRWPSCCSSASAVSPARWPAASARRRGRRAAGWTSLRRIGAFSRSLGEPTTEPEMLEEIARQGCNIAGAAVAMTALGRGPEHPRRGSAARYARRCRLGRRALGLRQAGAGRKGTATLPSSAWRFLPMRTVRGPIGLLGVRPEADVDQPLLQALAALADQAAVAMERVRLANDAARSAAHQETQKLRTALLSSLSHDLRTPLAGIRGAAGTLREAWDDLDATTRSDLLRSIEDDTARMTRFLANILDMTRWKPARSRRASPRWRCPRSSRRRSPGCPAPRMSASICNPACRVPRPIRHCWSRCWSTCWTTR